jgi:hypothetical protein
MEHYTYNNGILQTIDWVAARKSERVLAPDVVGNYRLDWQWEIVVACFGEIALLPDPAIIITVCGPDLR